MPLGVSSVFGGAKATQEADNVIILQPNYHCPDVRAIEVCKNRYDGELGTIPYRFDRGSHRILELDAAEKEQLRVIKMAAQEGEVESVKLRVSLPPSLLPEAPISIDSHSRHDSTTVSQAPAHSALKPKTPISVEWARESATTKTPSQPKEVIVPVEISRQADAKQMNSGKMESKSYGPLVQKSSSASAINESTQGPTLAPGYENMPQSYEESMEMCDVALHRAPGFEEMVMFSKTNERKDSRAAVNVNEKESGQLRSNVGEFPDSPPYPSKKDRARRKAQHEPKPPEPSDFSPVVVE